MVNTHISILNQYIFLLHKGYGWQFPPEVHKLFHLFRIFQRRIRKTAKIHQKIVTVGVHTEGAEILQNYTTEKRNSMGLRLNPLRRITEKSTVSETQPRLLGTYLSVYKSPYHDSVHNSINDEYEQNEANTASRELQREVIKTSDIDPNVGGAHRKIQLYHYGLS